MIYKKCTKCLEDKELISFRTKRNDCKECEYTRTAAYRKTPIGKYKKYKLNADSRKLEFKLEYNEFLKFENINCHYCGDKVDSISLDRINNTKGYAIDNVVSSCYKCNALKHTADEVSFLSQVSKIYLHRLRQENE